jgi:hypothetical protein
MKVTGDWAVIVAAFVGEWMDLEGFMEVPRKSTERELKAELDSELDRRKDSGVGEERTEL